MLTKSVLIGQFAAAGTDVADRARDGVDTSRHERLRKTGASCFVQLRQAGSRDVRTCRAFPRLADQTLKGLEGLPGKPVVEFADLLRLGNGGLVSPLHEFGVNRHRLVERPSAAELLDKRPELLERFPGVVAIGVRDGLQGHRCGLGRCTARPMLALASAGSAATARLRRLGGCGLGCYGCGGRQLGRRGAASAARRGRRLGRLGDGTTGSSMTGGSSTFGLSA